VRELRDRLKRDDERCDPTAPARHSRTRDRLKRTHQLHIEHSHVSLHMLQDVVDEHPFQLAQIRQDAHRHHGKTPPCPVSTP
jgi:hypothetical protein